MSFHKTFVGEKKACIGGVLALWTPLIWTGSVEHRELMENARSKEKINV